MNVGEVHAPWWDDGKPLAIVGCGPSLRDVDHQRFEPPRNEWRVLAVASALWSLPFADCAFDLDWRWIRTHQDRLRRLVGPELYLCWPDSQRRKDAPDVPNATWVCGGRGDSTFSENPARLEVGGTSGFGATQLTYLKRQTGPVVLFGFDYREDGPVHHARVSDYPDYPTGLNERYWLSWARNFHATVAQWQKRGVHVLNASERSAIACFPKCSVESGLTFLRDARNLAA